MPIVSRSGLRTSFSFLGNGIKSRGLSRMELQKYTAYREVASIDKFNFLRNKSALFSIVFIPED